MQRGPDEPRCTEHTRRFLLDARRPQRRTHASRRHRGLVDANARGVEERVATLATMSAPSLPATAVCPGCQTMVVLPVEPRGPEDPLICGTCGVEVPDYRVEAAIQQVSEPEHDPEQLPE